MPPVCGLSLQGLKVDVFTLFFIEATVLILLGLTMIVSSIGQSGRKGHYWFAASNICGAIGLLLHFVGPAGPLMIVVVLANVFLFVELTFMNKAIAEFLGRGRHVWLFLLAISFAMTYATVRYTLYPEDHNLRIEFISVVTISTALSSAVLLFGSLGGQSKIPNAVMGLLFSIYAAANAARFITVWWFPKQNFLHIWFDRTVIIAISLGFVWMTADRMRRNLERLASTDALTGALNRRALEREAERIFARRNDGDDSIAALMLDVDKFKQINDGFGHTAGDKALCAIAECLRESMRAKDLIARLGGDEFFVVMPHTSAADAELAATRLQEHMTRLRISCDAGEFGVEASIGIASAPMSSVQLEDLLKLGDRALYAAKDSSRRAALATAQRTGAASWSQPAAANPPGERAPQPGI